MDAYGFVLKGNSKTAAPGYIPSLIGNDPVNLTAPSAYFERVDITDRSVNTLMTTKWVDEDSGSPILGVKGGGISYYIPFDDLYQIAASNHDDDTIALLETLRSQSRP